MRQMMRHTNMRWGRLLPALMAAGLLGGCSMDSLLKSDELPPDVADPSQTQSLAGALTAYHGTLVQFRSAYGEGSTSANFVVATGVFSDELELTSPSIYGTHLSDVDRRDIQEGLSGSTDWTYNHLQKVRGDAAQAIGLLRDHAPESHRPLIAHVYAIQGYAEVFLAELFCSGIPLSTLDYKGDYTLRPGSSTAEVYRHAITLFDSALALAGDSTRFLNLARVGKARALLGLGELEEAAAVAAQVPDGYQYLVQFGDIGAAPNFAGVHGSTWSFTVSDREGLNGLDFRASGDPRTAATHRPGTSVRPVYHPNKYSAAGSSPIVLASGIEARLIEAEAALGATGTSWLTTLNELRTTGTYTGVDQVIARVDTTYPGGVPQVDTTFRYDTLWVAGTGGVAKLGPLQAPATLDGRVDLVFRERAFWLFLTGQRHGDMRRLVRQYGRNSEQLYPVGAYITGRYMQDVTAPIPHEERLHNPQFAGCISRAA